MPEPLDLRRAAQSQDPTDEPLCERCDGPLTGRRIDATPSGSSAASGSPAPCRATGAPARRAGQRRRASRDAARGQAGHAHRRPSPAGDRLVVARSRDLALDLSQKDGGKSELLDLLDQTTDALAEAMREPRPFGPERREQGGATGALRLAWVVVTPDDIITLFDGSEYRVLERPSGPGDAIVIEFRVPDHCAQPLTHVHPHNAEVFEVLEGEIKLFLGSEWQTVRAGESVTVPPGARHTWRNHSGEFAAFRNVHDPHHDFEAYLRKVTTVQNELRLTAPDGPDAASRFAMVVGQYPELLQPVDVR